MLEHEAGLLFVGRDGALYLATYDEQDGGWVVSEERLEYVSGAYDARDYAYSGRCWPKFGQDWR